MSPETPDRSIYGDPDLRDQWDPTLLSGRYYGSVPGPVEGEEWFKVGGNGTVRSKGHEHSPISRFPEVPEQLGHSIEGFGEYALKPDLIEAS